VTLLACSPLFVQFAQAALPVVAWGDNSNNQITVPDGVTNAVAIAAGGGHNVAIKTDGTVVVWGYNPYGQLNVPAGLNNVVAASAGYDHSLALRNDGTIVAWGRNFEGQINVPAGLNAVMAVSANQHYSLALKSDGTVVAWGDNTYGQAGVPAGLANVQAISAGSFHALALKSDGTVVAWGLNNYGQINVPAGLSGVKAIAGGGEYSLALKNDGTLVAWGANYYGQTDVPAGLGNVVAISAGWGHNLALKADGTVVSWGWNGYGQANVPVGLVSVGAVSAGYQHSLALVVTNQPPTIACPQDAILQCANCDTDPVNTGVATATDDGPVTVSYSDSVSGDCPKVVTRTWTATDAGGKTATCVQTITCLESSFVSMVTDGSGCTFDRDPATPVQDFRLIFTQDPQNFPCYQVTASNPGQFLYNVLHTGTPGQQVTFSITLPYPFVTKGANPVHAYDWVTVAGDGGQQCLLPGNPFFVSSQQVELSSYGNLPQVSVVVTLTVPDSGVVFLAVHLDYGLEKLGGYTRNAADDAVDCDTGTQLLIPNHGSYVFSVSGAENGTANIANVNVFKKNPGIAGLVNSATANIPIPGAELKLTNAKGAAILSGITDEDGFYQLNYKHRGKAAIYYLSVKTPFGYRETKRVTLKANGYVQVDFSTP
jgi:alpha-tubulin suppressor-like RCC1 family protein